MLLFLLSYDGIRALILQGSAAHLETMVRNSSNNSNHVAADNVNPYSSRSDNGDPTQNPMSPYHVHANEHPSRVMVPSILTGSSPRLGEFYEVFIDFKK